MIRATLCLAFAAVLAAHAAGAHAGQACTETRLAPAEVRAGLTLALDLSRELDRDHAEIAIVARVGQDLSRYGLRYSHVGIAWRSGPRGAWSMLEELNQCGTAHSTLYDDGFGNFFLDDMFAYEAKVVIPSADVQRRIAAALASGAATRLHEPRYSEIAYPWSTRYQNCNQWVLETVAEALDPQSVADRAGAQAWLRAKGYRPTTLHVSPIEQFGAQLFSSSLAFDDHPQERLMAGEIDVVTAESVMDFVARIDRSATVRVLSVDPAAAPVPPARPAP
ncbi:MAG: DUF2145 domain-containing protein, partial [Proteobacteria bacterium]|nr:DUF2145 domain-containing protein [Pseudomonadota bacterium]